MDISEIDPWVDPAPSNAYTMTLNKLRQKINKKKPWAYRHLALRHLYGKGGAKKSRKKAIDYFKKGMKLGDPECLNELGIIYDTGRGVAKNEKLAFEHYQMGAIKGYDMAQYNLGKCYFNGNYVEQSNIKAREWYNRAAAQGYENAITQLKLLDEEENAEEE